MEKVSCKFLSKPLFPTPVGVYNFGETNHNLNYNLVEDTFKEYELDPEGISSSNIDGWHSNSGLEEKYESFKNLKYLIETSANHYCKFYGYDSNIICGGLWSNLNKKESFNMIHHHGDGYLTGVYYPAKSIVGKEPIFNYTDCEESLFHTKLHDEQKYHDNVGSLYLLSPIYSESRTFSKIVNNQYTAEKYLIYPTSSILLIFPTYLLHGVNPFSNDNTRISISFSIVYNG